MNQSGRASEDDLRVIEQQAGARIIDRTLDRALLVEASDKAIAELRGSLKGWIVEEEKVHAHPSA